MILRGLLPATRRSIVAASSLSRHRLQPQPPHLRPLCSTRIPGHDVDLSLTVVNVKALMESSGPLNAVQLTRLLADEEAGKNRVTLVKHIAGKLRARSNTPDRPRGEDLPTPPTYAIGLSPASETASMGTSLGPAPLSLPDWIAVMTSCSACSAAVKVPCIMVHDFCVTS